MLGGLWFDSLSANPLGVTILPLFVVGFPIYLRRELILRELLFAQFVLGAVASAARAAADAAAAVDTPANAAARLGFALAMACDDAGGGAADAGFFPLFDWLQPRAGYQPRTETSFRPDREIRRGRN